MYKDGFPENEAGRYVLGSKATWMTERGQRDGSWPLPVDTRAYCPEL